MSCNIHVCIYIYIYVNVMNRSKVKHEVADKTGATVANQHARVMGK